MWFEPPEELRGDGIVVRRYRASDLTMLKQAIATSHEHLRGWMPWAATPPTDASVLGFLTPSVERFGGDAPANYAITRAEDGAYLGGCGLMPRVGEGALEIGYWVDVRHTGRGIATEATRLLTAAALSLEGVDRVELHCDEANVPSAAIAVRLGYRLDRTEPEAPEAPLESGRTMIWIAERDAWDPPPRPR